MKIKSMTETWLDAASPLLFRLAARWADEWRYERPADYGRVVAADGEKIAGGRFQLVRMMPAEHPLFGCDVRIDGVKFRVTVRRGRLKMRSL